MDEPAVVLARDGLVELRNRHWALRVGVDGWSLPASEVGVTEIHSMRHADVRLEQGRLSFTVEVGPLSPRLVEINTAGPAVSGADNLG